ncbi:RagB/SusD family nutrient uptake outer membrane protein [Pedobacter africanus]|uniref:Starch-binding associating with outer membrane n=1 Tax=Pedobacter africanus TaxID=151894 RepID=A0A1W1Z5G4_9SPHI|nr:RagB/SusD family nutrient uptake outer membrane protein [Pedobacter africanus]SMC43700.1 Starch-binding associating with outer membrane [Pedobacter africanus]
MKRIVTYSLLVSALSLGSCTKFLDTSPTDFISPVNYFKTETDINTALAGVYDVLGKTGTYGRTFYFDNDQSDEWFESRSTVTTGLQISNITTADGTVNTSWEVLYNGVSRANLFLENVDKAEMDAKKKSVAKGEAMFLRAFYYFLLSNNWGDVPLRLSSTSSVKDVSFKNTPAKEIFDFIVKDMETAAGLVSESSAYSYNSRITKTVVWGILARVNLKMAGAPLKETARFAEARKWAKMVMDDGSHKLNPDYSNIFIKMCRDEYDTQYRESMWEVEFNKLATGGQEEEGSIGSINGIGNTDRNFGYSYGVPHATETYYNAFDPLDNRRDWSISPYRYATVNSVPNSKVLFTSAEIYNRFSAKWRREYEIALPKNVGTTPINFPILRYSDILLMFAEAENEVNGPTQAAIDAVNLVRKRAYGMDLNGQVIKSVTLSNQGSGYTAVPTLTISGGGGTNASLLPVISGGRVIRIDILSRGSKFTTAPTITLSGGGGSGAVATATISSATEYVLQDVGTKEDLREAIRKERSLELGYEGLRKFDLIRWGIYQETMESIANVIRLSAPASYKFAAVFAQNAAAERNLLLPIPSSEMMLNKLIVQNKGW